MIEYEKNNGDERRDGEMSTRCDPLLVWANRSLSPFQSGTGTPMFQLEWLH
jgi:hypothetical protein